jgi:hypothetical protein
MFERRFPGLVASFGLIRTILFEYSMKLDEEGLINVIVGVE